MTWEAASTLPRALIDEFESGMVSAGAIITDTKFGAIHHTLVVGRCSATDSSPPKRLKTTALPSDPGYCHIK